VTSWFIDSSGTGVGRGAPRGLNLGPNPGNFWRKNKIDFWSIEKRLSKSDSEKRRKKQKGLKKQAKWNLWLFVKKRESKMVGIFNIFFGFWFIADADFRQLKKSLQFEQVHGSRKENGLAMWSRFLTFIFELGTRGAREPPRGNQVFDWIVTAKWATRYFFSKSFRQKIIAIVTKTKDDPCETKKNHRIRKLFYEISNKNSTNERKKKLTLKYEFF
jgi:hypothetical protein